MPGFIRQADVQADSFIQMHSITGTYTGLCPRCVSSCECLSSARSGEMLAARDAGTGAAGGGPSLAPASDTPPLPSLLRGTSRGRGKPSAVCQERSWPCQRSPVRDTRASALHGAAGGGGESEGS